MIGFKRTAVCAMIAGLTMAAATTQAYAAGSVTGAGGRGARPLFNEPLGVFVLKNMNTGRCIDDSNPYGLRSYPCDGMNYQQWSVRLDTPSTAVMENESTHTCIADSDSYGLTTAQCNGSNYQEWSTKPFGQAVGELRSANTGLCIDDSNGPGLRNYECNGLDFQKWNAIKQ